MCPQILRRKQTLEDPATKKKICSYFEMLLGGEHIILDVDHWLMFLRLIAASPQKDAFWIEQASSTHSLKKQLKYNVHSPDELLERFELCNFLRLIKDISSDFTLVLTWERELMPIGLVNYTKYTC